MDIEQTKITKLFTHPDNPRQGDIGAIATSIEQNGWYGTIVAQKSTGHVLAGNHRLQAAQQLGMEELPVYWVDVDDTEARKILLADNRTNDLAIYDQDILAGILTDLASIDELLGTGYDGDDIDQLLNDIDRTDGDLDLSGIDSVQETFSAGEREEMWKGTGIRSIILPYETETFAEVVQALQEKRKELDLESNSEAVASLLGL